MAVTMLLASIAATASLAGPTVGVGVTAEPVCVSAPAQPGHSYTLTAGGIPAPGVDVANTGTAAETIVLSVRPLTTQSRLYGKARPVNPSWVAFGYPRHWLGLVAGNSVTLAPGTDAWIPVTLNLPAGVKAGGYAALLDAGTVSPGEQGGVSFGAGAATPLLFLAGVARPPASWPASATGCWDAPAPLPWSAGPPGPGHQKAPSGWHYDYQLNLWVYGTLAPARHVSQPPAAQAAGTPGRGLALPLLAVVVVLGVGVAIRASRQRIRRRPG